MPQGLQCWDAAGNLTLDTNDRITRIIGYADARHAGSVSIALQQGNQAFALFSPGAGGIIRNGDNAKTPTISISGGSVWWSASDIDGTIIYGVF